MFNERCIVNVSPLLRYVMKKLFFLVMLGMGILEARDRNHEISDFFNNFEQVPHQFFMSITEEQRNKLLDLYRTFSKDLRELVENISAENGVREPLRFKTLLKALAQCETVDDDSKNSFYFSLGTRSGIIHNTTHFVV